MQDLDFSLNYFQLFGLPEQFQVDQAALAAAYRELQSALHPDRFAGDSDVRRRLAVQGSSHVNEAYATLRCEVRRARYLLGLRGMEIDDEKDTTRDLDFLTEQMSLRESLEEISSSSDPQAALDALSKGISRRRAAVLEAFVATLDSGRLEEAREQVLRLRFFERLREQTDRIAERLEDELLG